jgi:hypothetical protein
VDFIFISDQTRIIAKGLKWNILKCDILRWNISGIKKIFNLINKDFIITKTNGSRKE